MTDLLNGGAGSINASNYLVEDMGEQDVVSETYVFGLTCKNTSNSFRNHL
jgi:hypothetical protein